jgi:hypothetical protein
MAGRRKKFKGYTNLWNKKHRNLRPVLVGVEPRHQRPPIIEVCGPPDIGKGYIARLLAKRLGGVMVELPNISLSSFTGPLLFRLLSSNTETLEASPDWWAHVYAANVIETVDKIMEPVKASVPVVVTNYVTAVGAWAAAAGADEKVAASLRAVAPSPDFAFVVFGPSVGTPFGGKKSFTALLRAKIAAEMASIPQTMRRRIDMDPSEPQWKRINLAVDEMCFVLSKKLGMAYNPSLRYTDRWFNNNFD